MPANSNNNPAAGNKARQGHTGTGGHTGRIIMKLWFPVLFVMAFIFYASSIPPKDIPLLFPFQDTVFHFSIYLTLAWFFARALKNTCLNITLGRVVLFTLAFGFIYGISDEYHQSFVPNRSACALDIFIDGLGSFMGGLVYSLKSSIL